MSDYFYDGENGEDYDLPFDDHEDGNDFLHIDDLPDDDLIDGVGFQDPGGESALRRATKTNPRNLPCPTCKQPNRLTPIDRRCGYQCDACARRTEMGY